MPKRLKNAPQDANQLARYLVDVTTGAIEAELPPKPRAPKAFRDYMKKLGARGGVISGRRRMTNLTPEVRREIASKAARTRWKNAKAKKAR